MPGRVALIIPYFEAGDLLLSSLHSVSLGPDDIIIVVDDGSKLLPAKSICPKRILDTAVDLITLPVNRGIAEALRRGIQHADSTYRYIARLDCGDQADQYRFSLQRSYLDEHPETVLVGSHVRFVTPAGVPLYTEEYPETDRQIRRRAHINAPFCHPAVMFRADTYIEVGGYSSEYPAAEDFAIFMSMLTRGKGANIDQVLVTCLTSDGGISDRSRNQQLLSRIKILREYASFGPLSWYGLLRARVQLLTSREFTTRLKRITQRISK